ncbi:MAG: hypothetical protein Q9166_006339 [cf. Caloplaca sp. 2 TL-2023]
MQSGLITTCRSFYKVQDGDYCEKIVSSYGTFSLADLFGASSVVQFKKWNPAVKTDCSQLYIDYYYCIAIPGIPTMRSTTSATKAASTASSGPTPTQSGIISCTKYYKTVSGDTCQVISDRYGTFSVVQFVTWNPAVKSDCSQLFLSYNCCIAVPETPTTRTHTSTIKNSPTPTPKAPQPQQLRRKTDLGMI